MNKEPLWTKDFISVSASNFFLFVAFYFLLVTMPIYAIQELGGSPAQAGLLTTFFLISAIIVRPFAGQWIEQFGKKAVLISSQVIFLGASLLYFFPDTLNMMLVIRFIHGIGFGMATTATGAMVAEIIPGSRRGEGMGYYVMSTNLAMVIGPFLGLTVMREWGSLVMFTMCIVISGLALIAGLLVNVVESKNNIRVMSIFQVKFNPRDLFEFSALPIAIVGAFFSIAYSSILSFVSVYAEEIQVGEVASYFFIVYAVVLLLSRPFTGRWFDQYGANVIVYPAIFLFAAGLLLLSQAETALIFLVTAGMIGVGWGTLFPSFQTIAIQEAAPQKKALATATFLSVFDFGIGLGSFIIGWAVTGISFRTLYAYCAIYVIVGLFVYLMLHGRQEKKKRQMV
ncbi:multidrug MFS transporter [Bacillus sp. FJAT-27231]|uniref:MFS transporter n=1 Tax=Bacillus sp. FJAT-27231 TaxID=1679168 RepID=UPI00067132AE|nr:MFS transporter [Bacillus sp. FJAT-27231]KMY52922.1 multidrug MFS transporter [Bacillus sp. FJAT-27231]